MEDLHVKLEQSYHDLPKFLNNKKIYLSGYVVDNQIRKLYNQQGEWVHDYFQ